MQISVVYISLKVPLLIRMIALFSYSLIASVLLSASRVNSQCIASETLFLDSTSGSLSSPNYPLPYHRGSSCRWLIVAPPNKVIELQFASFQTANDDHVVLRDGNSSTSPTIANLAGPNSSGQQHPHDEIYQSSGNYLYIEFSSPWREYQAYNAYTGFSATYSTSDGQETSYTANVTIETDDTPRNLPLQSCDGNSSCTWVIKAPPSQTVRLRLSLRSNTYWCQQELTVRDGSGDAAPTLYSYRSGDNGNYRYDVPKTLRSTQSYMFIRTSAYSTSMYSDNRCSAREIMYNTAYSAIPFNPSMLFNCYHDDSSRDYVPNSKSCSACQKTVVTKGSVYGVARSCVTPDYVCTPGPQALPMSDYDGLDRGLEGTVHCCYSDMCNGAEPVHNAAAVAVGFTSAILTAIRVSGVL